MSESVVRLTRLGRTLAHTHDTLLPVDHAHPSSGYGLKAIRRLLGQRMPVGGQDAGGSHGDSE